jgi:hypothetical protein
LAFLGQPAERHPVVRAVDGRDHDPHLVRGDEFRVHHQAGDAAVAVGERVNLGD